MARDDNVALRILGAPGRALDNLGEQLSFYGRAYGWTFKTIRSYKREIFRQLAKVTFGAGTLALVGGTAAVVGFINATTGAELAVQGYTATSRIGIDVLVGFFSAFVNTRIAVPLIATVALVATVGAGITAELGAQRISEEIDALEVMAVPSLPFLVTTRVIAGFIAIVPLYAAGLLTSYVASRVTVSLFYGQSLGTYDHYFNLFLPPVDILFSFVKVLVISVLVILIHTYYGYRTTGGPAGVGVAVGRSVRASLVLIFVFDIFVSLALWGSTTTVKIA